MEAQGLMHLLGHEQYFRESMPAFREIGGTSRLFRAMRFSISFCYCVLRTSGQTVV